MREWREPSPAGRKARPGSPGLKLLLGFSSGFSCSLLIPGGSGGGGVTRWPVSVLPSAQLQTGICFSVPSSALKPGRLRRFQPGPGLEVKHPGSRCRYPIIAMGAPAGL